MSKISFCINLGEIPYNIVYLHLDLPKVNAFASSLFRNNLPNSLDKSQQEL